MPVSTPKRSCSTLQRHHDLLERRVPRPLADPVHGALDLSRACGTPARVFATARPRSLWQWTERVTSASSGQRRADRHDERGVLVGQEYPTVSGRLTVVAPCSTARAQTSATKSGSERVASSHESSTSSTRPAAYETAKRAARHLGGLEPELFLHVDRARRHDDVHPRPARAGERLGGARGRRAGRRASEATVGRSTRPATARTPSKSPGEETAKPASITSTPSRRAAGRSRPSAPGAARCPATARRLAGGVEDRDPAVSLRCSSPRRVSARAETHYSRLSVGVCAVQARVVKSSPLEGENRNDDEDE